jgi:DHA2 family multidrug resistance protein
LARRHVDDAPARLPQAHRRHRLAAAKKAQAPYLTAPYSLSTPSGIAALNAEVTRQAAMVAYIDDFRLMMLIALATLPVLLVLRGGRRHQLTVAADD